VNKLSPTLEEIDQLRRDAPEGPVVMVNLLKFRPDGGRQAYQRYLGMASAAFEPDFGPPPKLVYAGPAGTDLAAGEDWDFVMLVEWASIDTFAKLHHSDKYHNEAVPIRSQALERTVLMMTSPSEPDAIWS
jgi:hypothetical protein